MKTFFFGIIFCLEFCFCGLGQSPVIELSVVVNDEDAGIRLEGATLEIYQDGKLFHSLSSPANGRFKIADLPINNEYLLVFKKQGFVAKMATLNTRITDYTDLPPVIFCDMEVSLFKAYEDMMHHFDFMKIRPLAKFMLNDEGFIEFDFLYTKKMLAEVEIVKNKYSLLAVVKRQPKIYLEQSSENPRTEGAPNNAGTAKARPVGATIAAP